MPEHARQAWLEILDSLEAGLGGSEVGAPDGGGAPGDGEPPSAWQPPSDPGPIPADLVARAQRLEEAQRAAIAGLRSAVRENRRHTALIGAVNASTAPSRAVYLDVAG